MDFKELSEARFAVRRFSDRPVEPEKLYAVLNAARIAPTAKNLQPQKVYVIKSPEALAKLRSFVASAYNAPMVLLFCADAEREWHSASDPGYCTGEMDVSIACTYAMLQAWDLGLGSVWVRAFRAAEVAEKFCIPKNLRPVCLLPIGYAADGCEPNAAMHFSRRPILEMTEEL